MKKAPLHPAKTLNWGAVSQAGTPVKSPNARQTMGEPTAVLPPTVRFDGDPCPKPRTRERTQNVSPPNKPHFHPLTARR